jgi:HSP20 family protein
MLAEFGDPFFTRGSAWAPAFGNLGRNLATEFRGMPSFDVKETESEVIVEAATPGFKKENLSVALDNDRLVISGQEQRGNPSDATSGSVFERHSFTQAFSLPADMKDAEIKASYQDGVLRIVMPKPQQVQPRQIAIEGGPESDKTLHIEGSSDATESKQ